MALKKEQVIDLYHQVFNNFQNRDSYLDVMRIAFEAGAKGSTFNGVPGVQDEPNDFDQWIKKVKQEVEVQIENE